MAAKLSNHLRTQTSPPRTQPLGWWGELKGSVLSHHCHLLSIILGVWSLAPVDHLDTVRKAPPAHPQPAAPQRADGEEMLCAGFVGLLRSLLTFINVNTTSHTRAEQTGSSPQATPVLNCPGEKPWLPVSWGASSLPWRGCPRPRGTGTDSWAGTQASGHAFAQPLSKHRASE